ncbi:MAG: sigma factor-like helix-turn-helix DNA-binding protein, partial [bacterium]|nr:sigma factor-like helix-turn-helix DNA-binding protein [bacterium]
MANKINTNDIGSFVSSFLVEHLIGGRYQDVIQGRYGLKSGEPQTLQAIGDRYGITRERVRQIEALALSSLKAKAEASPYFKSFIQKSIGHLKAVGGAQKEELFFTNLHKTVGDRGQVISFANQARLLLELSGKFSSYKDSYNKDWHCYWYLSDADAKKSQSFVNKVVSTLNERKEEVLTSSKFNEVVN